MTAVAPSARHTSAEYPFPGLRPFDYDDREYFFGREREVSALYRLIDFSTFIAVIGSSGSGKSSLVRAGLRPILEREKDKGRRSWRIAMMHPGTNPAAELADALATLTPSRASEQILDELQNSKLGLAGIRRTLTELGDDPVFLVVDQFEELFRYAAGGGASIRTREAEPLRRERAAHFVELLLEATRRRSSNIFVLITMRSDFIGDCAQFAYLPEAVSATQYLVPGLSYSQREEIICKPIEKAAKEIGGASIEPELVNRLLNDAGDEIDQLPVLQHCLARLWEKSAPSHRLTLPLYFEVGEIEGALSKHADELMGGDALRGKELAVEQVFRALSEVDREGRATRRPIPFQQLEDETGAPQADVLAVVDRFRADDCCFLAVSKGDVKPATIIDVGHEALLRKWKKISRTPEEATLEKCPVGWLWVEKQDGNTYEWLLDVAAAKEGATLPPDQVDDRLKWWHEKPRTAEWARRYCGGLDGGIHRVEQLFSDSIKKREDDRAKDAKAEHDRVVRRRQAVALLILLPLTFAAVGSAMLWQALSYNIKTAKDAKAIMQMEGINAGLHSKNNELAYVAHTDLMKEKQYYGWALQLQQKTQQQDTAIKGKNAALRAQKQKLQTTAHQLLTQNDKLHSEIHRETVATATTFFENGITALEQGDAADAEVFLAAAYRKDPNNGAASVLLASARDQVESREGKISFYRERSPIISATYTTNSRDPIFAAGQASGTTTLWGPNGNRLPSFTESDAVTALAFDPSGDVLAAGSRNGSLVLHFLTEHKKVILSGHRDRINAIAFSPSGHSLATTSMDGSVKLWSANGQLLHSFDLPQDAQGFPALGYVVKFTPDGSKLLACTNEALEVWELHAYSALHFAAREGANGAPGCRHLAVSPDGTRAVTDDAGYPGAVDFYSLSSLNAKGDSQDWNGRAELAGAVTALSFDPSNSSSDWRLVVGGEDGSVTLTDWTMQPTLLSHYPSSSGADRIVDGGFSADGVTLFVAQADGTVSLYDLNTDSKLSLRAQDAASALAMAPGGNAFITTGETNGIPNFVLWHIPRPVGARILVPHSKAVTAIAAAPDGNLFATGSRDGTAHVWKRGGGIESVAPLPFASDGAWVDRLRFDVTGTWLAAAGGTHIRVWNVRAAPRLETALKTSSDDLRFSDAWPTASGDLILAQREEAQTYDELPSSDLGIGVASRGSAVPSMGADTLSYATDVLPIGEDKAVVFSRVSGYAEFTNLKSKKSYRTFSGVSQAAYCPRRDLVFFGGIWGGLSLASAQDGARLRYWHDHPPVVESGAHARVATVACSDDGAWLASAGTADGMIRIWSVAGILDEKLAPVALLRLGYPAEVSLACFSHDARFVLTLTSDGRTQLWNRESGQLLEIFKLPGAKATAAAFVFGGSAIAIGYDDGRLAFYPLSALVAGSATMRGVLEDVGGLEFQPQGLVDEAYQVIGGSR